MPTVDAFGASEGSPSQDTTGDQSNSNRSTTETDFKAIAGGVLPALQSTEREENFEKQRELVKGWIEELKEVVAGDPDSIWADDAQYLICLLNIKNSKQEVIEREYLLENYPGMEYEAWTKENLYPLVVPEPPMGVEVRFGLCKLYLDSGNHERLRELCEESIREIPEYAVLFESYLEAAERASGSKNLRE